jgi:hypothetical protein
MKIPIARMEKFVVPEKDKVSARGTSLANQEKADG